VFNCHKLFAVNCNCFNEVINDEDDDDDINYTSGGKNLVINI